MQETVIPTPTAFPKIELTTNRKPPKPRPWDPTRGLTQ